FPKGGTVGKDELVEAGLVISGTSPAGDLVEFVELPREAHPYYVATQAHPEFRSRPDHAHPLFAGLVEAALDQQRSERLVEVEARQHQHQLP
ncbi:MAG: CTP synthase, partial [Micrococcus sp.]|nr:CTP synthase [Micrococcus sp.]